VLNTPNHVMTSLFLIFLTYLLIMFRV